MKNRALIMIAMILTMASCSKDECPEPEKPKRRNVRDVPVRTDRILNIENN